MKSLFELPEMVTLSGRRLSSEDNLIDIDLGVNNECTSGSGSSNGCNGGSGSDGNGCTVGGGEEHKDI